MSPSCTRAVSACYVANPTDRLTVRDLFWDEPVAIPRERWRFVVDSNGVPKLQLDGGFDPGRRDRVTYRPTRPVVAGVGLAAIRDAASAFRNRSDLPIWGSAQCTFLCLFHWLFPPSIPV